MLQKILNRHGFRQFVRYSSSTDMSKPVVLKSNPENGFTTVILNKPPVNSLGMNVMKELIRTFEELVSRVDLRASFLIIQAHLFIIKMNLASTTALVNMHTQQILT